MIKYLTLLLITLSFALNAQNEKNKLIQKDSNGELYMMNSISEDSLWSLKVCSDSGICKGFLTEKDTSESSFANIDPRMIMTKVADFSYKIEYKWRDSKQFIVDTFNVYCLNGGLCIATNLEDSKRSDLCDFLYMLDFMPSSSDDREVLYVTRLDEKIIIYDKIK